MECPTGFPTCAPTTIGYPFIYFALPSKWSVQRCVDSQESLTREDRPELSGATKEVTKRNNTDHILERLINCQYLLPPIKLFYSGNTFLVYTTKDLGDGGRSEKKRRYNVNSKWKSTKNSFLAGSFLTCWLAGPFCRNLLLSTNDLEDVACWKGRWRI